MQVLSSLDRTILVCVLDVHAHEIGNWGGGFLIFIPSSAAARDATDAGLLGVGAVPVGAVGVTCFRITGGGSLTGDTLGVTGCRGGTCR